jgi:hypothetical protein
MAHQRVYPVAVDGKPPVNKKTSRTSQLYPQARRLTFAAVALFVAVLATSTGRAESGPFAGMAGKWAGAGTVTLEDGSNERIRCRATYQVIGPSMEMSLTCASDAYKFNLQASVVDQGGTISGTWSETSRNIGGSLAGRGGGGNFQVVASAAGFSSNITLKTAGNKQSVAMRADSQFRAATISLSK